MNPGRIEHPRLRREIGVGGATLLGLGSILGTGIFVSLGVAAGVAGPALLIAIAIAAVVATFNALNSAQLAASHPVSGGTYEYGYRYLRPWLGFSAGWMFLAAKSASAATAALGFAGYLLQLLGGAETGNVWIALGVILLLTLVVLSGIRLSNKVNAVIVSLTILALLTFVVAAVAYLADSNAVGWLDDFSGTAAQLNFWPALLQATALMFVAYTGYGRIATLGEEVREPRKTIPHAIVITLWASAALYLGVGIAAIAAVGAGKLAATATDQAAPLAIAAFDFAGPGVAVVVAAGALTAMLGVLLNLILGLSRVMLAMGRRGDLPPAFSRINAAGSTPILAVVASGAIIAVLAAVGNVKATWSFSAFSVLIYYAITNLAALHLPDNDRIYPRWVAVGGLAACVFLAFWVEPRYWLIGLGVLGAGLLWHWLRHHRRTINPSSV